MTKSAELPGIRRRVGTGTLKRVGGYAGISTVVFVTAAAALAPLVAPHDPNVTNLGNAYATVSADHWLGTDSLGRDLFSRMLYGGRPSLLLPFIITMLTAAVGTALCLAGAWYRSPTDTLIARVLDVLFSFPSILLAILATAIFGRGLATPVFALALALLPYFARVVRSAAITERSLPYVESLMSAGVSSLKICVRHILPNVLPIVATQASLTFGTALGAMASLSYLGLGVQPPTSDWGVLIAQGQEDVIAGHPQQLIVASALIVGVVITSNSLADRLIQRFRGDAS